MNYKRFSGDVKIHVLSLIYASADLHFICLLHELSMTGLTHIYIIAIPESTGFTPSEMPHHCITDSQELSSESLSLKPKPYWA